MTDQEFSRLIYLKEQLDGLKEFAYGPEGLKDCFKDAQIIKLTCHQHYDIDRFPTSIESYNLADKEVYISKDLADDIMNLVKEKIKKLQEEFDNFKTE